MSFFFSFFIWVMGGASKKLRKPILTILCIMLNIFFSSFRQSEEKSQHIHMYDSVRFNN